MKALPKILRQLNILHIRFGPDGEPESVLVPYIIKTGKAEVQEEKSIPDPSACKDMLSKAPMIIAVSGKGVITKDASAGGIIETVISDPDTFMSTRAADGSVSFVRREQLSGFLHDLSEAGIIPMYIECLPDGSGKSLAVTAEKFCSDHLKWKNILKPSEQGSQLATLVAKRIQLPVLGIMLLMLMGNFLVSSSVREDFQTVNTELAALRKSASATTASSGRKEAAFEHFSRKLPYRFCLLADRIAAAVPEKVVLNELAISPVVKNVEPGKPVQQYERSIVIRGDTPSSESLASFVGSLGDLNAGTVKLASVEHDNEKAVLTFKVEIEL